MVGVNAADSAAIRFQPDIDSDALRRIAAFEVQVTPGSPSTEERSTGPSDPYPEWVRTVWRLGFLGADFDLMNGGRLGVSKGPGENSRRLIVDPPSPSPWCVFASPRTPTRAPHTAVADLAAAAGAGATRWLRQHRLDTVDVEHDLVRQPVDLYSVALDGRHSSQYARARFPCVNTSWQSAQRPRRRLSRVSPSTEVYFRTRAADATQPMLARCIAVVTTSGSLSRIIARATVVGFMLCSVRDPGTGSASHPQIGPVAIAIAVRAVRGRVQVSGKRRKNVHRWGEIRAV